MTSNVIYIISPVPKLNKTTMDIKTFNDKMDKDGWCHIPNAYSEEIIDQVNSELANLDQIYVPIQKEAGIYTESVNAYHHTIMVCPSMLKLLDPNPIHELLSAYFNGKYILNTMGASIINPNSNIYTQKIHRDIRSHTNGLNILTNTLIMLDDSTEENGATWMFSGSHTRPDQPNSEEFYNKSVRAVGKRGDVLIFDGNIWHAAGENKSKQVRRILTPIYTKPFMKQQLDYPRAFGYDFARTISTELRQTLGYNSLVPTRLDEFYQPTDKRFYKSDQG